MIPHKHVIRLIFGLKVRELRKQKGLSFAELSQASGLSVSYLNEIERGKKYPKADKILALSEALEVSYDNLVSLKLSKRLSPVADLLRSSFFQELPLEFFGLEPGQLLELIAGAPTKINAFISTLIEIARNYEMQQEQFYFAAVRSYQELNDSYFEDIEKAVADFSRAKGLDTLPCVPVDALERLLRDEYGYKLDGDLLTNIPELTGLRSLFNKKKRMLMINPSLSPTQRAFLLARELGFNELALKTRPLFTPGIQASSFEEALNNFKASYFAVALLVNQRHLIPDLEQLFARESWNTSLFTDLLQRYQASPEMLVQRLTNLLPRHFGIRNLFMLRFRHVPGDAGSPDEYFITKELHLARLHSPHANEINEHYCRRWASIRVLQDLRALQLGGGSTGNSGAAPGTSPGPLADFQRSTYVGSKEEYLILSLARPNAPSPGNISITLGLQVDDRLRKLVAVLNNDSIPLVTVNDTCERCPLNDCLERVAPPLVLEREARTAAMRKAVEGVLRG
ncbi:MAG: helix-turn-helix domain-containing protein [Bacteroidetes bacterium]|nr:helix-turn-helix domain-containing protein [Bacteroidota bacterium]